VESALEEYKQQFIEFMVRSNVLTFGDFVTKSGRKTPFFINTGNYSTGEQLTRLGQYYAAAVRQNLGEAVDVLFGPAYKGIPLAVATATALFTLHGQNVSFCFNRKEAKDHGEGGTLIGRKLREGDRVVIVEDVTTAGTSVRESIPLLKGAANVVLAGLVVSVDRMERGTGPRSALQEIREDLGINAFAIVTLEEIIQHLHNRPIDGKVVLDDRILKAIAEYRAQYGAVNKA
jgi:orotate phosphoribosyltransferase